MRLAVVASHPIQYHAPLFRALAKRLDLRVFYAHRATPADQAKAGFEVGFDWDSDLFSGYDYLFLRNIAKEPCLDRFRGCDTPEIGARIKERRCDAVLVLGWHLKTYLQAAFAARRLGVPVLARSDSHLYTPRAILWRAVKEIAYPWFLRLFDGGLYVGEWSRAYWLHYRYPQRRLFFSPYCIDTEWFAARATAAARNELRARLGLSEASKVALFAGKLLAQKRPLDLVAAAARLKAEGFEIVVLIAGAGPLERDVLASARTAGVPLYALGFCNQTEMPAVYSAADILVLPSSPPDTWGLVANEALACGCPVVLSDMCGAAQDLAADGKAGTIFPAQDVGALAAAMKRVLLDPPSPLAIRTKSSAYSPAAATSAILAAVATTIKRAARIAL